MSQSPGLALSELLDLLRLEGFAIGVDDHIRLGKLLAVPSHRHDTSSSESGLVFMHERSDGIQRASSKTLTARRCSAVSSGGSATVGRRPMPPVVVRTSVA